MVESTQRRQRSLFGAAARRRSQVQQEEATAAAAAVAAEQEHAAAGADASQLAGSSSAVSGPPPGAGPPPLPSPGAGSRLRAGVDELRKREGKGGLEMPPPPPVPPRPDSVAASPEEAGLDRTASPPGWPSLHELVPPADNDEFVSPRTDSFQSAQSSPAVGAVAGGWQLQASPRGGSLVLPGTPAASAGPRVASSLARSLSALSAASPAGTPQFESPQSPYSPKQLAAAKAVADAKAAMDRAHAATSTAAQTMEVARETARLRRERQRAEAEARRSLDAARHGLSPRSPEEDARLAESPGRSSRPALVARSVVPDDAADDDVSMAMAAGDAISSLLSYLQSSKEEPRAPAPQLQPQLQPQQMAAFPSPSGLTFGRRLDDSDTQPPPLAATASEPAPVASVASSLPLAAVESGSGTGFDVVDEYEDEDSNGGIDPELWARSVATALAFRGFTQGVRASRLEAQRLREPQPEPEPEVLVADPLSSEDDEENSENIAPTGSQQRQRQRQQNQNQELPSSAGRLKALQSSAFERGQLSASVDDGRTAAVTEETGSRDGLTERGARSNSEHGVLKTQQQKRTTVVAPPSGGPKSSSGKLMKKREDRRTHTQQQQQRDQGSDVTEQAEHTEQGEDEHVHWSRRAPGPSAAVADGTTAAAAAAVDHSQSSQSSQRRQRAAKRVASPHKAGFAVRAVSSNRGDRSTPAADAAAALAEEKKHEEESSAATLAQAAAQQANAQLRADRQRRARSATRKRPSSPAPSRRRSSAALEAAGSAPSTASAAARPMTAQEIAKAEYRSYRRVANQSRGVTDSGNWHAEREAYLQLQRMQQEEQRQAECTGRPNLSGSFAAAVNTAVAAAVEAAVKAEKVEREAARKVSPARLRRQKRDAVKSAARAVARARSPSPEKEQEVAARQRENIAREAHSSRRRPRTHKQQQKLSLHNVTTQDEDDSVSHVEGEKDGSTRSVSRQRQAELTAKLAALEEFRLENLRLEEELAEAKLREKQARLAKRPTTPGDRQRAWEQGRQERELINALEEREAAAAAERARAEARALQREDERERRRDRRQRGSSISPSRSDWDHAGSPSSPGRGSPQSAATTAAASSSSRTNRSHLDRSRSHSRRRSVSVSRDLSSVPTMSSRHKKTTVDRTGGAGAHLRDKTNVSDTRTQRDVALQRKEDVQLRSPPSAGSAGHLSLLRHLDPAVAAAAAAAATTSPPRRPPSSTRRRLSLSPPPRETATSSGHSGGRSAELASSQLATEHTMSSRHRKTTATPRGRVQPSDLSHGGVTAAELFQKFQSGQHLRDGRSTAESTQSTSRRAAASRRNSPARVQSRQQGSSESRQETVSARLATPKRGTLFQQSQADQEAAALVRCLSLQLPL
jgi:hypothetical protein